VRRLLRFTAKTILAVLVLISASAIGILIVHQCQLGRLHRLAQASPQNYVIRISPYFVLTDVHVIDGTGVEERSNQNIVVHDGKIQWIGNSAEMPIQTGAQVVDGKGETVIPGLVMMHEHLFTSAPSLRRPSLAQQSTIYPLLYLAEGVTTARTAGSVDPASDLRIKRRIDRGDAVGPELFLTGPYLEGAPALYPQMHALTGAEDATRMIDQYSAEGFTSFKAYADITSAELQAAITEAHARSAKVTGHLCTITFREAADMGIDNLEHGLLVDTEFYSGKKPDVCPPIGAYLREYRDKLDVASPEVVAVIDDLIAHHVALTSTLAVFEGELGGRIPTWYQEREKSALTWQSWQFARMQQRAAAKFHAAILISKAEQFEYSFARRGGILIAGSDPTGDGSVLAGYADLRELELLVEAGFTPVQAIQIATQNGASFLGISDRAGTLEKGKQADFVVIDGDPGQNITDVRNVRTVYRLGIAYDTQKMLNAVDGIAGLSD
jgi:imidazolonepropionase-like amidohydrolase